MQGGKNISVLHRHTNLKLEIMKSTIKSIIAAVVVALACASCGTTGLGTLGQVAGAILTNGQTNGQTGTTTTNNGGSILGGVLGAVTNGDALGNILGSVIGLDKMTEESIVGTWKYKQPGVAFTSDKLLAKAGGEIVASQIKEKLSSYYNSVGIKSSNTYFQFNADHTFSGKLLGTSVSGQWSYNEKTTELTMKTLLFTLTPNVKASSSGMSILFESKKLLTVLQTVASVSGNATLQGIGNLSTNYDGVRMGFDMSR